MVLEDAPHSLVFATDSPGVPSDADNLVARAAALLRQAAGIERGARLRLEKRIPVAAGLGGGSTDAAATLLGLNRLWGVRWSLARLAEVAGGVGVGVRFFLLGGRARAQDPGVVVGGNGTVG